jgi:hypothetical protein
VKRLHVVPETVSNFLEKAMPMMPSFDLIEEPCPFCHRQIRYPLMARQRDVDAIGGLFELAEKYLDEHGVTEKILRQILDEIALAQKGRTQ